MLAPLADANTSDRQEAMAAQQIAVIPGEEAFKLPGPEQWPLVKG